MFLQLLTFAVFAVSALDGRVAPPTPNCAAKADGYMELGCWGFHQCSGGRVNTLLCRDHEDLERDSLSCKTNGTGHTACRVSVSCVGQPDGQYPDISDNCETYFWCENQQFLGHFYCPMNLFFNGQTQQCDWPQNVPSCFNLAPVPGQPGVGRR